MASTITKHQARVLAIMETMTPAEQAQAVRLLAQLLERPGAPEAPHYFTPPASAAIASEPAPPA